MKKAMIVSALLLALLLVIGTGCTVSIDPTPTDAPATEAAETEPAETEAPAAEFDRDLAGDWYGIFSVGDAGGKYAENSGKANDCAVRFALGDNGEGPFYCVINGLGDGDFEGCRAAADMNGVSVEGSVGGRDISWRFDLLGGKLSLSALFGGGNDYMRIEMILRHCGEDWSADMRKPAGFDYTEKYGFYGIVEQMGGSLANVPELTGEGLNLRLTTDEMQDLSPAFDDEGRTISANGHFSIVMPEGYSVSRDGNDVFAIKDEEGMYEFIYTLEDSDETPMEALMEYIHTEGYNNVYHMIIDGYDCVCTIDHPEDLTDYSAKIVVIGQKDEGRLLRVTVDCSRSEFALWMIENSPDFAQAVLGLLVNDNV